VARFFMADGVEHSPGEEQLVFQFSAQKVKGQGHRTSDRSFQKMARISRKCLLTAVGSRAGRRVASAVLTGHWAQCSLHPVCSEHCTLGAVQWLPYDTRSQDGRPHICR